MPSPPTLLRCQEGFQNKKRQGEEDKKMRAIRNNIINDANARDKYIQGVKLLKNDFLRTGWPNTYDIFVIWHYNAMITLTPPSSTSGRKNVLWSRFPPMASLDASSSLTTIFNVS